MKEIDPLKVLTPLIYENDGRYFAGINGDSDVTDIVKMIEKRLNKLASYE